MPEHTTPPSAAAQIWPHLPHDDERVAKPSKHTAADAMWPALSRETKANEEREARAEAERKARLKRTAENLQEVLDSFRGR